MSRAAARTQSGTAAIRGRRLGYGLATAAFLVAVILIIASITTL